MLSAHLTVASTIFEALADARVPPPILDILEGISSLTTDNEIRYNSKLKEDKSLTLQKEMEAVAKDFKRSTPPEIRKKITPVMKAGAGISKVEYVGLPYDWEVIVHLKKFKPFHLMQTFLDM